MEAGETVPARELRIAFCRDWWADFEGTAAQLTGEGLLPKGAELPAGTESLRWSAAGMRYWLRRTRPTDHKGPMRTWLGLDHWCIRVTVERRDHYWIDRRRLERQEAELKAARHALTFEGMREHDRRWKAICAARSDAKFQAFKARVPGLIPPKRGRKPKARTDMQA